VVTANGLLPYKQFLLLVQIKPVCEKLSFWITNNAMGSGGFQLLQLPNARVFGQDKFTNIFKNVFNHYQKQLNDS
jgi:hypothetical protein